jgi:hypothetical protein
MCNWQGCPSQRPARALTLTASISLEAKMYGVTDCKIKTGKLKVQDSLHMEYIIFKLSVNLDLLH